MRHLNAMRNVRILKLLYDSKGDSTAIEVYSYVSECARVKHRNTLRTKMYEKRIQINYCQLSDQNVSACKTPTNCLERKKHLESVLLRVGRFQTRYLYLACYILIKIGT